MEKWRTASSNNNNNRKVFSHCSGDLSLYFLCQCSSFLCIVCSTNENQKEKREREREREREDEEKQRTEVKIVIKKETNKPVCLMRSAGGGRGIAKQHHHHHHQKRVFHRSIEGLGTAASASCVSQLHM